MVVRGSLRIVDASPIWVRCRKCGFKLLWYLGRDHRCEDCRQRDAAEHPYRYRPGPGDIHFPPLTFPIEAGQRRTRAGLYGTSP